MKLELISHLKKKKKGRFMIHQCDLNSTTNHSYFIYIYTKLTNIYIFLHLIWTRVLWTTDCPTQTIWNTLEYQFQFILLVHWFLIRWMAWVSFTDVCSGSVFAEREWYSTRRPDCFTAATNSVITTVVYCI